MKVAVIGGGIFGCTAAILARRAGHDVHLFEARDTIMQGASWHNQFRLHRGYHYPRSAQTGAECRRGLVKFVREYNDCIEWRGRHIYALAKDGSKTSADAYRDFCRLSNLHFSPVDDAPVDSGKVSVAIEVDEPRYNAMILRLQVMDRLRGVRVHLVTRPKGSVLRRDFDRIVVAAYGNTNRVLGELNLAPMSLRYEICEKPVVRMPEAFGLTGVVVMDGPFGCIDPYGLPASGMFVMGHVVHAIHAANETRTPEIPKHIRPVLHQGMVQSPPETKFPLMRDALAEFVPMVADAKHMGSMFVVRAVLPNRDATDERPTMVERLDDQVIRVFSGKVPTCVEAAEQVVAMLSEKEKVAA